MKYKDEDPDNLGGLGGMLPAELLKLLQDLLERMHQTENNKQGSKIEIVIVQSGGQHVETQINVETLPHSLPKGRGVNITKGERNLPEALSTEKAMVLWEKVRKAGYVDDNFQPLISRTQAALLADAMAERLGIRKKWKVFETLWNRTKMYKDYYQAVEQKQFLPFLNKLKQILD